jgi:hypothetical protein
MIEYNTVSVGGLGLTTKAGRIQQMLAHKYADELGKAYTDYSNPTLTFDQQYEAQVGLFAKAIALYK